MPRSALVEDVFSTVNEHTERTSQIVRRRGGAIVEFNGDGMMAVFGAPEALAEKERHAIEAAREIVDSSPPELAVESDRDRTRLRREHPRGGPLDLERDR